ncbi:MAG: hypothetical protein WAL99_04060 [Pseudonocardiaceae bacterium]
MSHRTYDCQALNPYRRQHSGITGHNGRWEVHYDPYDVTRIWLRNHHDRGWITVPWTHLNSTPTPLANRPGRRPRTSWPAAAATPPPKPTSPPR